MSVGTFEYKLLSAFGRFAPIEEPSSQHLTYCDSCSLICKFNVTDFHLNLNSFSCTSVAQTQELVNVQCGIPIAPWYLSALASNALPFHFRELKQ